VSSLMQLKYLEVLGEVIRVQVPGFEYSDRGAGNFCRGFEHRSIPHFCIARWCHKASSRREPFCHTSMFPWVTLDGIQNLYGELFWAAHNAAIEAIITEPHNYQDAGCGDSTCTQKRTECC